MELELFLRDEDEELIAALGATHRDAGRDAEETQQIFHFTFSLHDVLIN